MAYIKHPIVDYPVNSINVYNWKTLQRHENGVRITIDFQIYFIYNCNIIEIHEANLKSKRYKIEKKFEYVHNVLSCVLCEGRGKLDWIHNITKPSLFGQMPESYRRKAKGKSYMVTNYSNKRFFFSSQHIPKGYEECSKCFGTGLNCIGDVIKTKEEVII